MSVTAPVIQIGVHSQLPSQWDLIDLNALIKMIGIFSANVYSNSKLLTRFHTHNVGLIPMEYKFNSFNESKSNPI